MQHLSHEFSVELLLAYIELVQFKKLMEADVEFMRKVDPESDKLSSNVLSDRCPKSYIVFEKHKEVSDSVERYKQIAEDLYGKYVDSSAELQINLSYKQTQNIETFIEGGPGEHHVLYTLYDDAIKTVHALMSHSHVRF